MARKPVITHNGVEVWRVYDGSESRSYWFALHQDHTEDGDNEHQFDVRDLVTYEDNFDSSKSWAYHNKKILKGIRDAIDIGHLTQTGIVPTAEQIKEQQEEERQENEHNKKLWNAAMQRFGVTPTT